jgi:hypothetical protein
MPKRSSVQKHAGLRRGILTLSLASTLILFLTACGMDVHSRMAVDASGAGDRVMTMSLGKSDAESLKGGVGAADSSIKRHTPAGLTFSGLTTQPDGSVSGVVTLHFDSTSDYKSKIETLLSMAPNTSRSTFDFTVVDNQFRKGININESFTSSSLLKWVIDGLIVDGVISESDRHNAFNTEAPTELQFKGAVVATGNPLKHWGIEEHGFSSVRFTTDISSLDVIKRTIHLETPRDNYTKLKSAFDDYMTKSAPSDTSVTSTGSGSWDVAIQGDAGTIEKETRQIMGDDAGTTFAIESTPMADDPASLVIKLTDRATCSTICSTTTPIQDKINGSKAYNPATWNYSVDDLVNPVFSYIAPIQSVTSRLELGDFSSPKVTTVFTVRNGDVDRVGDGFSQLFLKDESAGKLSVSRGDDKTTFTVSQEAETVSGLETLLAKWAPGSQLTEDTSERNAFTTDSSILFAPAIGTGRHVIEAPVTTEIQLSPGVTAGSSDGQVRVDASVFGTVATKSSSGQDPLVIKRSGLSGLGLTLVILLILGLLVVAAFIYTYFRNRSAQVTAASLGVKALPSPRLVVETLKADVSIVKSKLRKSPQAQPSSPESTEE